MATMWDFNGFYRGHDVPIAKWLHQNEAEPIDCVEGSLLDSTLYACKRGYAFTYECYLNCNESSLRVLFIPYKDENTCNKVLKAWDNFSLANEECEEGYYQFIPPIIGKLRKHLRLRDSRL